MYYIIILFFDFCETKKRAALGDVSRWTKRKHRGENVGWCGERRTGVAYEKRGALVEKRSLYLSHWGNRRYRCCRRGGSERGFRTRKCAGRFGVRAWWEVHRKILRSKRRSSLEDLLGSKRRCALGDIFELVIWSTRWFELYISKRCGSFLQYSALLPHLGFTSNLSFSDAN